jgi:starch phosphorylase
MLTGSKPSPEALTAILQSHLRYTLGKYDGAISAYDAFRALGLSLRPEIVGRLIETLQLYRNRDVKRLYYLSMEFLIGQSLANNLGNLGLTGISEVSAGALKYSLQQIIDAEPDAALGNGGLGRLAACFLESLASLDMPGFGYGLNYEFGLFKQSFENGYQKEDPDYWRSEESPWIISHPDETCAVPVYGHVEHERDRSGNYNPMWMDWKIIIGVPHDIPIVGYGGRTVNYLRLYSARASDHFKMSIFNSGDYLRAVEEKIDSEKISKLLYPSDAAAAGKELRFVQEYFLVACAIRDITRIFQQDHSDFSAFADKVAIQLNDTHPALAVVELMRLLIDEQGLAWEQAWEITRATCAYTNHTLLPEALEKWSVEMFERVLPRHLQIVYEINHRFMQEVKSRWPHREDDASKLSLIEESGTKQVRMAHLAIVGGHAVNGVAELHSDLVKKDLLPLFHELWPNNFQNKTNGVTHRRWLAYANPELSGLISEAIGLEWMRDFDEIRKLEPFASLPSFQERFADVKQARKQILADIVRETALINVDPQSVFDVQIKRIHEYKRQLLHILQIIYEYLHVTEDGIDLPWPITHIFGGKAAPGYAMAKLIIKLANSVASVVNSDPKANRQMRIVFLPDYRVSLAEKIIPAADVSEQISTAGMEASGTGNMKLTMNGALTLGTLDGANVEIQQEVGSENIYIFGLTVAEVDQQVRNRSYHPQIIYEQNERIRRVIDALNSDRFNVKEPDIFRPICHKLLQPGEQYFHLADLPSYIGTKEKLLSDYRDTEEWRRRAILNIARSGKFSSDRTIRQYASDIWGIEPMRTVMDFAQQNS